MIDVVQSIAVLAAVGRKFIHSAELERDRIIKEKAYEALDPYEKQQEDLRQTNRVWVR